MACVLPALVFLRDFNGTLLNLKYVIATPASARENHVAEYLCIIAVSVYTYNKMYRIYIMYTFIVCMMYVYTYNSTVSMHVKRTLSVSSV